MASFPAYKTKPYYGALSDFLAVSIDLATGELKDSAVDAKLQAALASEPNVVAAAESAAAAAVDANPTINGLRGDVDSLLASVLPSSNYPDIDPTGATESSAGMTAFLNDAAASGRIAVLAPGTYRAKDVRVPSNTTLHMDGATVRLPDNTDGFTQFIVSGETSVAIRGGTLDGNAANQTTWNEHRHGIRVLRSRSVQIEGVTFLNPIADGVYISRQDTDTTGYLPSEDVTVKGCTFIGTNINRNGISVACARKVQIKDNTFFRMSRATMPGAIDLEPDWPQEILEDIEISGNMIDGSTGPVIAQNGICLANHLANATISGIQIIDNIITGSVNRGIYLVGHATGVEHGIVARGNIVHHLATTGLNRGIATSNIDADVSGNTVYSITGRGIEQAGGICDIRANRILGTTSSAIYQANTSAQGVYETNTIRDCTGMAIQIHGSGSTLANNRISSALGTMTHGIVFNSGSGNIVRGNHVTDATQAQIGGSAVAAQTYDGNIGYRTRNAKVESLANGSTPFHSLAQTPTKYGATATKPDRRVAITAATATQLTISLTDGAGTAITVPEPVAWWAEV